MRILYVYMEFYNPDGKPALHRGLTHFQMNFGTKEYFRYKDGKLEVLDANIALPERFWGENIYNVTALAGDNGSGKSTIMNCLMGLLGEIYDKEIIDFNKTILVLEEKEKPVVLFMPGRKSEQLEITGKKMELYMISTYDKFPNTWMLEVISKTKLIYLTNTINEGDFQRAQLEDTRNNQSSRDRMVHVRNRFLYDCSTCGMMVSDYRNDVDWKSYQDGYGDKWLEVFFSYEKYKQVKYVFDKKQYAILKRLRNRGYHVPVPEKLTITIYPANFSLLSKSQIVSMEGGKVIETKELMAPGAALQVKKWKEQVESHKMRDTSTISIDVLVYELCCNCIQSLYRNIMHVLEKSQKENEFINYFMNYLNRKKLEKVEAKIAEDEFLEIINMFIETYRIIAVDREGKNVKKDDLQWMGECSRTFIQYLFREKEELSKHFQMIKPVEYYLIPSMPHNSPLKFSILAKDAEWFSDFLQKYRYICNPHYFLDFNWGLSSGEDNLLRLFTSLYYIFEKDYANEKNGDCKIYNIDAKGNRIACESVILFMDEADLTYHPEWQRRFVSILTAFIQEIYPKECCREVQIILSTHSPLLLGDMPSRNVIYLKKDEKTGITQTDGRGRIETFGQNIHLILRDSFFLSDGTIGEFAGKKIQNVVDGLEEIRRVLEDWQTAKCQFDFSEGKECISKIKEEFEPVISLLAEGIIKSKLMELASDYTRQLEILTMPRPQYKDFSSKEPKRQYADFTSEELKEELERISRELNRRGKGEWE